MVAALSLDDIREAASRIAGLVHRTPVVTSRTIDSLVGAQVLMKAEHLQLTGSFKLRGATNALLSLDPAVRSRGVVAFSSGNHAQAVAAAAQRAGVCATIVMPADAPAVKVAGVRGYGGEVVTYDRFTEDREAIATQLADSTGRAIIPPYDSLPVIAGQGTVGLELVEDARGLDVLVIPVSGGGLSAGCAIAVGRDTRIVVVEPAAGNDVQQSLAAGSRVRIPQPTTIADGLAGQVPGALTFPFLKEHVSQAVTVSDADIVAAMVLLFERCKHVVEPSGAVGIAALLTGQIPDIANRRVGVVLSGGNVGSARFASLLADYPAGRSSVTTE